jgi:hypothetical protein
MTGSQPPGVDTTVPNLARVYDYWLGGKDNFTVDREAGDRAIEAYPDLKLSVRANRAFLARAVRFLAGEAGIRQFLDIGSGLPSANNTHEVAQADAPQSRIMYVDKDPIVITHGCALLNSSPEGACACVEGDLREPEKILARAAEILDFGRPAAIMMLGVLQTIEDAGDPWEIVTTVLDAVANGSYLVITHPAIDINPEQVAKVLRQWNEHPGAAQGTFRPRAQVARFFDGLELLEPGVVRVPEWRPRSELEAASPCTLWGGVARKPD